MSHSQRGATLIEVLVTILIMSVGLLGLGATQILSLKNANNANHTYFASLAAYEIVERMRANPIALESNAYVVEDLDKDGADPVTCSTAQFCGTLRLAEMDLYEWAQTLSANLPEGKGSIATEHTVDSLGIVIASTATVTVEWTEQNTGAEYGSATGGSAARSFELVVEL